MPADTMELRHAGLSCRLAASLAPAERDAFTAFALASPAVTHHQLPVWPEVAPALRRHRYRFLTCRRDGDPVMTAVLRFTRILPGRFLVSATRGPVVHDPDCLEDGLPALVEIARAAGAISLVVNPRWSGEAAAGVRDILVRQGFSRLPDGEQRMHSATGLIDLTPEPDEIFASFKQRGRRSIRKGEAAGVSLRRLTRADDLGPYEAFWRTFAQRKGFDTSGIPALPMQVELCDRLGGVPLALEHEGEPIGLLTSVRHGERGYFLAAATADCKPEIPKLYVLLWHTLLIMRAQGCRSYDLAGMPETEPRDAEERNRMQFKQAFNPLQVSVGARHVRILRPVQHALCADLLGWLRRWRGSARELATGLPGIRRLGHAR